MTGRTTVIRLKSSEKPEVKRLVLLELNLWLQSVPDASRHFSKQWVAPAMTYDPVKIIGYMAYIPDGTDFQIEGSGVIARSKDLMAAYLAEYQPEQNVLFQITKVTFFEIPAMSIIKKCAFMIDQPAYERFRKEALKDDIIFPSWHDVQTSEASGKWVKLQFWGNSYELSTKTKFQVIAV